MPAQPKNAPKMSKQQLLAKLKNKAKGAWKEARGAEPKARGAGGLPGGIDGGVALLKKFAFAANGKGDPYFQITGIVVEPEEYAGRQASTFHFINDDPASFRNAKSAKEKLEDLSADIQLLGGEPPDDIDGIPDELERLCAEGIHYVFNTYQSEASKKKGGMAKVFIQGLAEGYENDPSGGDAGGDEPAGDESGEGEGEPVEDETGEEAEGEGGEAAEGDAGAEYVPQPGDPYKWRHPKLKKNVDILVVGDVDEEKRTLTIKTKGKVNGKVETYKKVSFDKLIGEE